jgi:hypothetical protein
MPRSKEVSKQPPLFKPDLAFEVKGKVKGKDFPVQAVEARRVSRG